MTTREQAEAYRGELDSLVVLLLAELVRQWTAAGLPILPFVGAPRQARGSRAGNDGGLVTSRGGAATTTAALAAAGTTTGGALAARSGTGTAPATLTSSDVVAATQALLETIPGVVGDFQSAAATIAADFYDLTRADRGVPGRYAATPRVARDDARQEILVRWATQPLRTPTALQPPPGADGPDAGGDLLAPDVQGSLLRLVGAAERQVLAPARETISGAVDEDPADARWARVAKPGTCAFCLVMAGRGAVYRSRTKAGDDDANRYHDDCGCIAVPSWPSAPYELDETAVAGEAAYYAAREQSGSGDLRTILSAMRTATGSH